MTEECDTDWAAVSVNGREGYMMRKFLRENTNNAVSALTDNDDIYNKLMKIQQLTAEVIN